MPSINVAYWAGERERRGTESVSYSLSRDAELNGRYFGAAVRIDQINNEAKLREALLRDCSYVTPEIHMKWDAIEPRRGEFVFAPADDLVVFAQQHGLRVRGHTLLWDQSTPKWAREAILANSDWKIIQRYFTSVISRYSDTVIQWDVINEPIDTGLRGDGLRANLFLKAFGPDYISRALEEARALAPKAGLAINDYGFEYENQTEKQRRSAFLRLLERLKRRNAPLDVVGVQAHLDLAKGPLKERTIANFLREVAGFGHEIIITELDVKERDLSIPLEERDRLVAAETLRYLEIVLDQPAVRGVMTWGLSDRHSWLQTSNSNLNGDTSAATSNERALNRGLPYDESFNAKKMYWAIRHAFSRQRSIS